MPFVARHRETGDRIDITQIPNPRTALKYGDCECQLCGQPLVIKAGDIVAPHFAHHGHCDGKYEAHPESPFHRAAKIFLMQHLPEEFSEYANANFYLEYPVKMDWRPKGRIVDLMAIFDFGWRVAHKIQLASITPEELQERTDDYLRAGIDVVWWLGKSADTDRNQSWCLDTYGYWFQLTREAEQIFSTGSRFITR